MGGAIMSGSKDEERLFTHLRTTLEDEDKKAKARSALMRRGLRLLLKQNDPDKLLYKVTLISLWADHGEQSVSLTKRGPLALVMQEAVKQFQEANHRNDLQADYYVHVILESRGKEVLTMRIPESLWSEHKWKQPERR